MKNKGTILILTNLVGGKKHQHQHTIYSKCVPGLWEEDRHVKTFMT